MSILFQVKKEMSLFKEHVLKRIEFYLLFCTRFGFNIVTTSMSTYYKAFALTFIGSDVFITSGNGIVQAVTGRFSTCGFNHPVNERGNL